MSDSHAWTPRGVVQTAGAETPRRSSSLRVLTAMGTAVHSTRSEDPFWDEWLPTTLIHVVSSRQRGQWYALAVDFDIAGTAPTEDEAKRNMGALVYTYLRACHEAGKSYEESQRPVPRPLLEHALAALGRALRHTPLRISRDERLPLPQAPSTIAHAT